MKISPAIIKIYDDYFKSFEKKRRIIKASKHTGQLWLIGDIMTAEEKNKDFSHKGDISGSNVIITETISRINELMENRVKVIEIHICSGGGEVSAGFTIYDYLRKTNLPIVTIAYGEVCSMAADLFQIGVIRKMTTLSTLMLHHIQCGVVGTPEKIARKAEEIKYLDKLSFTLISMRSGIPLKKLEKMSHPLVYFTAADAIKLNLADEII